VKRRILLGLAALMLAAFSLHVGLAQQTTTQTQGPQSTVAIFYIACNDRGVVELSGEMQTGFDVYFQLFSAPEATGVPLSSMRQVSVNGSYTFSEVVPYTSGATVATATVGSIKVTIARESDATRSVFTANVNDLQDGCANPTLPPGTSTDLGSPTDTALQGTPLPGSGILSPFGGELNPGRPAEPLVKIGARAPVGRSDTAGLIFAECDAFPLSHPGLLYDTDDLIVFWSWFARTAAQVQDHIDHAVYSVKLNGETFPFVERSDITQRGRNFWVFYVARIGSGWNPGQYGIEYKLTWDAPTTDGFDDFGPGTENEVLGNSCTFDVLPNPWGIAVNHIAPPIPRP
jgi:hypothetical protein